jgi:FlaA1/EpsC-like NDP-sugar epimerase
MVDRAENGLFEICSELQAGRSKTKLIPALADVKHVARMSDLFDSFKPNVIFHAAAYKHVPILESHPTEAVLNNVVGTVRLAHLARARSVETFVFISTDKAVKPSNLMGATKRVCELYLAALNKRSTMRSAGEGMSQFRVVRFGNVLGSAGSALPLFQRQIESGSPITITDPEMSRFFMTIQEAVALVLESATLQAEGDITVLDMGEPVRITNLADDLVTALGLPSSAVARRVIGPRPGEKLHEVLWDETDEVVPSAHPRIVSLRQPGRPLEEMETFVRDLERLAMTGEIELLLSRIHEMVPTYRPHTVGAESPARRSEKGGERVAPPASVNDPTTPVVLRPAVNQAP